jgi:hypothetical protein
MKKSKGSVIAGFFISLILSAAMAIAAILIFFLIFKVNVDLQLREQFIWNKVQEVPMDLLSMSLDGESFISRMNKVHYLGDDEEEKQLRDQIDDIISNQLFYYFEGTEYPFTASINIGEISITKYLEGCYCKKTLCYAGVCDYECCDKCPEETKGKDCRAAGIRGLRTPDNSKCLPYDIRVEYSAKYPFPLTFNGTDKFTDELSYKAIEEK